MPGSIFTGHWGEDGISDGRNKNSIFTHEAFYLLRADFIGDGVLRALLLSTCQPKWALDRRGGCITSLDNQLAYRKFPYMFLTPV